MQFGTKSVHYIIPKLLLVYFPKKIDIVYLVDVRSKSCRNRNSGIEAALNSLAAHACAQCFMSLPADSYRSKNVVPRNRYLESSPRPEKAGIVYATYDRVLSSLVFEASLQGRVGLRSVM